MLDTRTTDEQGNNRRSLLDKLIAILSGLPWLEFMEKAWRILRQVLQSRSDAGMYEVLSYESTLELKDRGETAQTENEQRD